MNESSRDILRPYLRTGRLARLLIVFVILAGITQMVVRQVDYLGSEIPMLRLWNDARAQVRLQVGEELYETLSAVDSVVPYSSAVLLVTPGIDPRHAEYYAFHRTLYHLAPRPVWWANSAPPDGTWESRWWTQIPLAADAIAALAKSKPVQYVLLYQATAPTGLGDSLELNSQARLISLRGEQIVRPEHQVDTPPDRLWQLVRLGIGLLVVLASGYAVVGLGSRLGYNSGRIESVGLAWAFGSGVISVVMLGFNALGIMLETQIQMITGVISLSVLIVFIRRLVLREHPFQ